MKALLIAFTFALAVSGSAFAQPPAELVQYNSLLHSIENSKQKQSLQGFFYIAKKLEATEISGRPAKELETLKKTKGFFIFKEGSTDYSPALRIDPKFFLTLAKNHGTEEDIKFFDAYAKFTDIDELESGHPYMKDAGAGKACINTSSPFLYDFYRGWLKYLGGFPSIEYIGSLDIYQSYATSELDMYVFYLTRYDFCEPENAASDVDNFIQKVQSYEAENSKYFTARVIKAIKVKR